MTPRLRAAMDEFDAALLMDSRDVSEALDAVELQLRVWLDDVAEVRRVRSRQAEGRCVCGRRLEPDGRCRVCAPGTS